MVIVKIAGGLGNQLFQFALGFALEQNLGLKVKYDIQDYKKPGIRKFELSQFIQDIDLANEYEIQHCYNFLEKIKFYIARYLRFPGGLKRLKYYLEDLNQFDDQVFQIRDGVYVSGYWQNERYFFSLREKLLEKIQLTDCCSASSKKYLEQIRSTNSVAIHVRRGDYISDSKNQAIYGTCDLAYYQMAIEYITSKYADLTFYIFSDDLAWVKTHMKRFKNIVFVENNSSNSTHDDFILMSQCSHQIIANSTFSWWAAWLNPNPNKMVIAPRKWFIKEYGFGKEIVPADWVKI